LLMRSLSFLMSSAVFNIVRFYFLNRALCSYWAFVATLRSGF
jgi:hypothetical protein